MTAADPRDPHPAARPEAVAQDRLVGISRAARQISALAADERGQRQLIEADERARGAARREPEGVHGAGAEAAARGSPTPASARACLAEIWPSASTTASKVSNVEAWRGL